MRAFKKNKYIFFFVSCKKCALYFYTERHYLVFLKYLGIFRIFYTRMNELIPF